MVALILVALLLGCTDSGSLALEGISQGNRARNFTLEDLAGNKVSLKDYRGQIVLINFWATWCPPCQAEIPDFERAFRARHDDGFVVLGISVEETAEMVGPFVDEFGMSYPVLLDSAGRIFQMYRVLGLPMSLLLDRDGVIQVRHVGFLSADQLDSYLVKLLP
jgi:peroxiredoxin